MSNGELFLRVCRLVVDCWLFVFCPGNPLYNVLWENRVWPKEPLAQDPRKRNGAGAGSPWPARSFKRISYKERLLINLGLIVALPPMTARSQATKFLAFLLRFTKKIWFWLQHAKVPRILHAMNGICWNPHARKSAQGRSARVPNIPKSYRNFRQPPYPQIPSGVELPHFSGTKHATNLLKGRGSNSKGQRQCKNNADETCENQDEDIENGAHVFVEKWKKL